MSYRALPEIAEDLDPLQQRLRLERNPSRKERLHLILLIKQEHVTSQAQAAQHLARHRNTISDWLKQYRQGGLDALLQMAPRGKKPGQRTLPEPVFEALKARLATSDGFAGYDHIQQWLFQEFGLQVPYKSVYNLVRYRLQAKLKTPRPEHPKKTSGRPPASPSDSGATSA